MRRADGRAEPNFHVGDYVLRSRVDEKTQNKLWVKWLGPYVIVEAMERAFKVRHLVSGKEKVVTLLA